MQKAYLKFQRQRFFIFLNNEKKQPFFVLRKRSCDTTRVYIKAGILHLLCSVTRQKAELSDRRARYRALHLTLLDVGKPHGLLTLVYRNLRGCNSLILMTFGKLRKLEHKR